MQAGHAHIHNPLNAIAHDLGRYGRFLRHRQITRSSTDDSDIARAPGQRLLLDGHAAREFVMDRVLEFFPQRAGVFGRDARDEDPLLVRHQGRCDFHDLNGRLARAKDDFGKAFAQRPVRVHLGEAEIRDRRGLKRMQHLIAAHAAGAKLFEELDGFSRRHWPTMPQRAGRVTREFLLTDQKLIEKSLSPTGCLVNKSKITFCSPVP